MNDVDLIRKLEEINECKKQSIDLIKQNIVIINEIIYNSLNAGELLFEQNNFNSMNLPRAVVWYLLGNMKYVFFIKNNTWFNIVCKNSSTYIGFLPHYIDSSQKTQKTESADDDIVIEYIEFILSNKIFISDKIDSKIESLKQRPEQMDIFINNFRDKLK